MFKDNDQHKLNKKPVACLKKPNAIFITKKAISTRFKRKKF